MDGVHVTGGKEPSLTFALSRAFWYTFAVAAIFKVGQDVLGFVSPLILK